VFHFVSALQAKLDEIKLHKLAFGHLQQFKTFWVPNGKFEGIIQGGECQKPSQKETVGQGLENWFN
jgi:hypothetical protein